jgi:lactate racemase
LSKLKTIEFQYGKNTIKVKIPENSIISFPHINNVKKPLDGIREFKNALGKPIESPRLSNIAGLKENVVVVIPDRTRPMPTDILLPIILNELNDGGIEDVNITAIIALGTHRGMTKNEIQQMVGKEVLQRIPVINHDWDNPEVLLPLGRSENGTWIDVNKIVYEADLVVGLSSVKPHRAAGWSGGAKIIDPGVCGKRTIDGTHYSTVDFAINEITGVLDNPIRKEMENVAKKVGLDFSINIVLSEKEEILHVSAGNFIQAHKNAVEFAEKIYRDPQSEKADFMVCGSGSWGPDFWGAVQAIFSAEYLVKDGGTVVFFTECPEGFTPEHPQILEFGYRPIAEIKKLVTNGKLTDKAAAGHIAAVARIVIEKNIECVIVSEGISKKIAESVGLKWMGKPQSAVDYIFKKHGNIARG